MRHWRSAILGPAGRQWRLLVRRWAWAWAAGALILVMLFAWRMIQPPASLPSALPARPNFAHYPAGEARIAAFKGYMRPLIRAVNARIAHDRARVKTLLLSAADISANDHRELTTLARRYGMETFDPLAPEDQAALLTRVQIVPERLALAQAALESGWGTSRFAQQYHNYFGHYCFRPGCGAVPPEREPGSRAEIRVFDSPLTSVEAYMANLNTFIAYADFRTMRATLPDDPAQWSTADLQSLASTLTAYSTLRKAYTVKIQTLIAQMAEDE